MQERTFRISSKHYLLTGCAIFALCSTARAQSYRFLGVPNGGGQGNIGQTDPSCTVDGNTISCPNGGVLVNLAIYIAGWDDGTGRRIGVTQATVDSIAYGNGAFKLDPLDFYDVSQRQNGAYSVLSRCSGGDSDGIACGDSADGPFRPGQPGVNQAECIAGGGLFCDANEEHVMAGTNTQGAVARGPVSCSSPQDCPYSWGFAPQTPFGASDPGVPAYYGDLVLEVPVGASGLWTIGFLDNPDLTFMNDDTSSPIAIQELLPAIIRIGGDCNNNGVDDFQDIDAGTSNDCNANGIPDECETDCNGNRLADECDLASGTSNDCNNNDIPDECDTDCNGNRLADECDLASGTSPDCNANNIPDECDDCNGNGTADVDDIAAATSLDCNDNCRPDECETDCDANGVPDECDLAAGTSKDCNNNSILDSCDVANGGAIDCNDNGNPDVCDITDDPSLDCDNNGVIDSCDVADGSANDCNGNGVPDLCDDCNNNGVPDEGDVFSGNSLDCNDNCVPDECDDCNNNGTADVDDIAAATSLDCNANCVPDECDPDCNLNSLPDECDIASGTSTDSNSDGVPDECIFPPALPGPPHGTTKNRYLSIALRNGSAAVAMSVTLPDGREAWIGEPTLLTDRGTDGQWVADLQISPAGDGSDQVRDWSQYIEPVTGENVVHLRGCAIFPNQTYEIRAHATGLASSDPAVFSTTAVPSVGTWADCVGTFDSGTSRWSEPNGITNVQDIVAVIHQFQQKGTNPVNWTDLAGEIPNYVTNASDIAAVLQGYQSLNYWANVAGHSSIADCVIPAP